MRLKKTLDVTNAHCAKVSVCQDGMYEEPIRVTLWDNELLMGDIPVYSDKLSFDYNADINERTYPILQNVRLSHIHLLVSNVGALDSYAITIYITYPNDTGAYILSGSVTLSTSTLSDIYTSPSNSLVFPAGSSIIINVATGGAGPYSGVISAKIVTVPAVI
jgi:hypothetical protein